MTDTQYETIDDPAPHPQVNKVRGEYVDGEMSEADLEVQLEQSLQDGPSLCSQAVSGEELSGLDRIIASAQLPGILAILALLSQSDGGSVSFNAASHSMSIRNTDPSPDSHPAEKAGEMRTVLYVLSPILYLFPIFALTPHTPSESMLGTIAVLSFAVLATAAVMAPCPTVRWTDEGVGTHVAD